MYVSLTCYHFTPPSEKGKGSPMAYRIWHSASVLRIIRIAAVSIAHSVRMISDQNIVKVNVKQIYKSGLQ